MISQPVWMLEFHRFWACAVIVLGHDNRNDEHIVTLVTLLISSKVIFISLYLIIVAKEPSTLPRHLNMIQLPLIL